MKRIAPRGFTLLESIVSLVILGLVGSAFAYYLAWGAQGYVTSRESTQGSLAAQIALERLSFEIKAIVPRTTVSAATNQITYETSGNPNIPATRTLALDAANGRITLDGNLLLDGIATSNPTPTLTVNTYTTDVSGDGATNDIESIVLNFSLAALPSMVFTKEIHPRGLVTLSP
ncbi:type II secretion system protein [Oceanidesulfovibrio marinus]|uniref:Prepilin-type N-terminal cleavage/methylation domain-containing protein n=1 Tax=Oceanidesulfovibrio marinus TaxID=370038 RepID=A0A6P1ZMA6_9BACT|nr:type II secretion system protein [Oceanidesulfovibrio marinus]TVM36469.1 hypothetical protein DQK91_00655 [Oceanidesulfovibrio marinus]